jgi:hypothetical protein
MIKVKAHNKSVQSSRGVSRDLACAEVENVFCSYVGHSSCVRGADGSVQTYSNLPLHIFGFSFLIVSSLSTFENIICKNSPISFASSSAVCSNRKTFKQI